LAGRGPRDARDAHPLRFELVPWLEIGASGAVGGVPLVRPVLPTAGRRQRGWAVRRRWGELREGKERGEQTCGVGWREKWSSLRRRRLRRAADGRRLCSGSAHNLEEREMRRLCGHSGEGHSSSRPAGPSACSRGIAAPACHGAWPRRAPSQVLRLAGRGVRLHGVRSHLRRGWVHRGVAQTSVRRTPPRAPRGQQLGAGALCARARRGRRRCQFLFHLRRFKHT
jgi:hypothetical protein